MDRRESLRTLLYGSASATFLAGCISAPEKGGSVIDFEPFGWYGRVGDELLRDRALFGERFFTDKEMENIEWLVNLIIPADTDHGGAIEARVPDFMEFIVKDLPDLATPLRGGILWLNARSLHVYGVGFMEAEERQRVALIDQIAYPAIADPSVTHGVEFFNLLRNVTATGYFTSAVGIAYLGYQGNVANIWDGVPAEVLESYQLEYDEKTLANCLKVEDRNNVMEW